MVLLTPPTPWLLVPPKARPQLLLVGRDPRPFQADLSIWLYRAGQGAVCFRQHIQGRLGPDREYRLGLACDWQGVRALWLPEDLPQPYPSVALSWEAAA